VRRERPEVTTGRVRDPAAAGAFYPSDAGALANLVDGLLAAERPALAGTQPRALVLPHAGYAYSGPVAAAGYALLVGRDPPRRVVLAGPAHFVFLPGVAVPDADAWRTPLGTVSVDPELRAAALALGAFADDRVHAIDHALEVHLPFLQRVTEGRFQVLPVAVGYADAREVADLLGPLAAAADVLIVSTDLSHDHDEPTAHRLDRATVDAILARDPRRVGDDAACGVYALRGVVELGRRERWPVRLLSLRTSADAGGYAARVVGYAALALGERQGRSAPAR